MKNLRNYLENQINELVDELRFYDVRKFVDDTFRIEANIAKQETKIEILSQIEKEREGNLMKFNEDGSFHLWCVHQPEGENQVIEEYDSDMRFDDFEYKLECSKCNDVTDSFSIEEIAHQIQVVQDAEELLNSSNNTEKYYLVSNDVLDDAIFCYEVRMFEQDCMNETLDNTENYEVNKSNSSLTSKVLEASARQTKSPEKEVEQVDQELCF